MNLFAKQKQRHRHREQNVWTPKWEKRDRMSCELGTDYQDWD